MSDIFSRWAEKPKLERQALSFLAPSKRWQLKAATLTGLIYPLQLWYAFRAARNSNSPFRWQAFWASVREICTGKEN